MVSRSVRRTAKKRPQGIDGWLHWALEAEHDSIGFRSERDRTAAGSVNPDRLVTLEFDKPLDTADRPAGSTREVNPDRWRGRRRDSCFSDLNPGHRTHFHRRPDGPKEAPIRTNHTENRVNEVVEVESIPIAPPRRHDEAKTGRRELNKAAATHGIPPFALTPGKEKRGLTRHERARIAGLGSHLRDHPVDGPPTWCRGRSDPQSPSSAARCQSLVGTVASRWPIALGTRRPQCVSCTSVAMFLHS